MKIRERERYACTNESGKKKRYDVLYGEMKREREREKRNKKNRGDGQK